MHGNARSGNEKGQVRLSRARETNCLKNAFFRGFGFITFADPNSVEKVLEIEVHELDGKKVVNFSWKFLFEYVVFLDRSKGSVPEAKSAKGGCSFFEF